MASPNICTCTLTVRDLLGVLYSDCELVAQPRKSSVNSGNLMLIKPKRAEAVSGVITLDLAETETSGEQIQFILNWNDGVNYGSVVFNPVTIPDQASLDLSTTLTIARG